MGSMLGHVESQAGHHRGHRRGPHPGRGRRHLRRVQGMGLQAHRPLPHRGRGSLRTAVPATQDLTRGTPRIGSRADPRAAQTPRRRRPGRRPRHHRLAPRAPPRAPRVEIDHQPPPGPRRARDTGAEETSEVLLRPVRSSDAEPDLAIRLHPLPPGRRTRCRDHQLARRLHPLRPPRHRTRTESPARSSPPHSDKPSPPMGSRPPR